METTNDNLDIVRYRRLRIQEIESDIKHFEHCIRVNEATVDRFKRDLSATDRLTTLHEKIADHTDLIEKYMIEVASVRKGEKDSDLMRSIRETSELSQKRVLDKQKIKAEKKKVNVENKERLETNFQSQRVSNYTNESSFRHFDKLNSSIYPNMVEKLNDMPQNMGFIIKGIWMFGKLPVDRRQPFTSMYERRGKDKPVRIIEFDQYESREYEKMGKGKKVLH